MHKNEEDDIPLEKLPEKVADLPMAELQANFSSLLCVITEQQTLIGILLKTLLSNGVISPAQLESITAARKNSQITQGVYEDIHKLYKYYYLHSKWNNLSPEIRDEILDGVGENTEDLDNDRDEQPR